MKSIAIVMCGLLLWPGCAGSGSKNDETKGPVQSKVYADARQRMVETQIIARGVTDSLVIQAMRNVPRHLFVPPELRSHAYDDYPLPIGRGQTISQPYIVALMTESLGLKGGETVFEVGTGSGYQAAVLAEVGAEVYSMEIVEDLALEASERLKALGYKKISVRAGDAYKGWVEHSPFDAVIVTAAPDHVPQPLVDQLKVGGRMIIPVGEGYQDLVLLTKTPEGVKKKSLGPVRFVPMTGKAREKPGKMN